jgi:tetraacyldisaccharide 4'-kinase
VFKFRLILFPLSFLFQCITTTRNFLYEKGIFTSKIVPIKSIVIGNISVGGTGKSPVTIYLANLLSTQLKTAILSRGYGRKTKGFIKVSEDAESMQVGDEPLMFQHVFGAAVTVAVCESRNEGIEKLITLDPQLELILLDDAFQHRQIKAGFNILLTTFRSPFFTDFILPAGDLRESRNGANRANVILVTKCPVLLDPETQNNYRESLLPYNKPVFFSHIVYGELIPFTIEIPKVKNVLLVTGIAQTIDLVNYLETNFLVDHIPFSDHHEFTLNDIEKIHRKFDTFAQSDKAIVTTYKDYMRLKKNVSMWGLDSFPWYFLPISVALNNEKEFIKLIQSYVRKN